MEAKRSLDKRLIAVIACLALVIVVMAFFLLFRKEPAATDAVETPHIGYAAEAKVMLDQDTLQEAFDRAVENAARGNVSLQYKNDAFSEDGTNFTCYIVNSQNNMYDMYIGIYTDAALTDQIFLSGLVPPGSGFESLELDRALEPGTHTVYVALSQVDTDEEGNQTLGNQIVHTMEFHVQ